MKSVLSFFFCLFGFISDAQNLTQYSLSFVDRIKYNPGYSGIQDANIFVHHRSQFVGLSPINFSNQTFIADMPLHRINSGIGLEVHNDFTGFLSNTSMDVKYAYHFKVRKSRISMGIALGAIYQSLNQSKLTVASGEYDGFVVHNDALLDNTTISSIQLNTSAGVIYSLSNFEWGISMMNLNNPSTNIFKTNSFEQNRVFVSNMSQKIKFGTNVNYEVYCLYKTDFIKHQVELSNILRINDNISTGLTLRGYNTNNLDAVGIFFGIKFLRNFWAYYNYDIPINSLSSSNYGSHELLIHYRKAIKRNIIKKYFVNYNSRYL
ncbi:MAG: PorP/SprF family type IX secretion system membrane protein [Chitinophagales bacterium]|nr:PorP/SprF family type IX secretion system membrane protein [Chitinophagales bacterium]